MTIDEVEPVSCLNSITAAMSIGALSQAHEAGGNGLASAATPTPAKAVNPTRYGTNKCRVSNRWHLVAFGVRRQRTGQYSVIQIKVAQGAEGNRSERRSVAGG